MKAEDKIKDLDNELRAIKTAYEQTASNLVLYDYILDVPVTQVGTYYFINKTVTFTTSNGANTIATIENATYDRVPYEGGAKFKLLRKLDKDQDVKLHSIQEGSITIS